MANTNIDKWLGLDNKSHAIKVNQRMPHRRLPTSSMKTAGKPAEKTRANFRSRYDELEARREELVARLHSVSGTAQQHPGYKRALKLLNDTFRKAKLAQRLAILQAAAWLINLLEMMTTIV